MNKLSNFKIWLDSMIPGDTVCIACNLEKPQTNEKDNLLLPLTVPFHTLSDETLYVDQASGPSIQEAFAYQLTEQLLLAGVKPEVFTQHCKVKGVYYHPGRGLILVECGGLEKRSIIEAFEELLRSQN